MTHDQSQASLDFLAAHHPFDQLPEDVLSALLPQLESCQLDKGELVLTQRRPNVHLHIIRSGSVEVLGPNEERLARLVEGDIFGQGSLLGDGLADNHVRATEQTVLYRLPSSTFHKLCRDYPQFSYFFGPAGRLRTARQDRGIGLDPMTIPVAEIAGARTPVSVTSDATIRQAAQVMTRERISSLMVVDDEHLKGILTDRDLRSRVVAEGLSFELPVAQVLTADPVTIQASAYAYEVLLTMARRNVHHLPVMEGERLLGMITDTDLLKRYSTSPLYLVSDVYKQNSVEGLAEISRRLQQMLVVLVEASAPAHGIGHLISSVGEAINCRLLALAEERFGPPPIGYAWLAGGSLGRREQTAHTDQDNCLLLPDDYREEQHGEYFRKLAEWVCQGLDDCGYILCPGDIMASNPRWRQPLRVWKDYFDRWIDQPDPKALL
ncbi:MAG: DUF294 nucleotidyltransferase-like domain-containing protein, partial [Candidatus Competibacteraceae bacterium]|nr:DUF294 nucleotidyltransferase-like domain-containing protein [Candidatus Competibacteraceae bacterium]